MAPCVVLIEKSVSQNRGTTVKKELYGRYELKYFLPPTRIEELLRWAGTYITPDKHASLDNGLPRYCIQSVYFDTRDLGLYFEKIDGLRNRRKFRVRSYCKPAGETKIFLEIKYRFNTQVMKDRAGLRLDDAQKMLKDSRHLTYLDAPLATRKPAERFCHYFTHWELRPVVTVMYDRVPFVGRADSQVRLTVDTNMRVIDHRNEDRLFVPRREQPVPLPGAILELKFDRLIPEWMRRLLRRFDIRQQSISKYAYCVEAAIFDKYEST